MKLPYAPDSVLSVESEQDAQHPEKANERKVNQSIRSQENYVRRNERKLSAVQNLSEKSERENRKNMLNNTSEVIDKINDSFLPANYEAEKMLQLVKMKEGTKISLWPAPWRKKFNTFSVDS